MDLLHLVDRLEEMIAGAQRMPIGNRAIVDRRRMLDLIDQMRVAIPEEVREAREIVAHRDAIRRDAEEDGRMIVARAEERAARLVESHEISQAARQRADDIAREAEQRLEQRVDEVNREIQERIQESRRIARQQMTAADDYARELLQRLDRQLQAFVRSVESGIAQLEPSERQSRFIDDPPLAGVSRGRAPSYEPVAPAVDDEEDEAPGELEALDEEARSPSPLRGEVGRSPQRADEDDLDSLNLLRRDSSPARAEQPRELGAAEPGVIDDFEHEPLDDDPMLRPRRGQVEER